MWNPRHFIAERRAWWSAFVGKIHPLGTSTDGFAGPTHVLTAALSTLPDGPHGAIYYARSQHPKEKASFREVYLPDPVHHIGKRLS